MTVRLTDTRQAPLVALIALSGADLEVGANKVAYLPSDSIVVGGSVLIETAFGAGVTLSLGDEGSATRYANAVNANTVARTALTLPNYITSGLDTLSVTVAGGTPDAAGKAYMLVEYVTEGRACEVMG